MKIKFLPLALALLFPSVIFAQDYEIKLSRPNKVGSEYKAEDSSKQSQETLTTVNGTPKKDEKTESTIELTGVAKVLAVDDKGEQTKVSITVEKLTKTSEGATTEIAAKGAVLTASRDAGKLTMDIDGKPVDDKTVKLLKLVVHLSKSGATDDEIFGTKDHKKKGDSWEPNFALMKEDIQKDSAGANLDKLNGKTVLEDVVGDNLKLSAHITGSFMPPLPPKLIIDQSSFDATFNGLFPIDVTATKTEQSMTAAFSVSAHIDLESGEKVVVKMDLQMSSNNKHTPLK